MSRMDTIGKTHTTIKKEGNKITVTYHSTNVVTIYPHKIILNTGGWYSNTTKTRMNQASNQFNLGFNVYQIKGVWFVTFNNLVRKFNEQNTLTLFKPESHRQ